MAWLWGTLRYISYLKFWTALNIFYLCLCHHNNGHKGSMSVAGPAGWPGGRVAVWVMEFGLMEVLFQASSYRKPYGCAACVVMDVLFQASS